ncbi:MAG TPA: branched-chain amino acid ABC transporter permease [Actinomycetota bacterium]|nr:branched-chain amino acid ABC transporter permease [Actinomycetota bacterium]
MPKLGDLPRGAVGGASTIIVVLLLIISGNSSALVNGLVFGSFYGLVALGLVLIYKSSGVFNFAQGEFGTVAVYTLWILLERGVPYLLAILAGIVAAIAFGLLTERLVIRPLFDAPRVILLVATAGVALLAIGLEFWIGGALLRQVRPISGELGRISPFGVNVSDQQLILIAALLILGGILAYFFNRTNLGLAIIGASQEPTATELVGISVKRLSSFTWVLAALLGAVAGILSVPIGGSFGPGYLTVGSSGALIPGFTAAVLGGMTSMPGAFVGGAIVGVAESFALRQSALAFIPGPDKVMIFLILLLVLALRPQGLLGKSA